MTPLEAALLYATRGWPSFPVHTPRAKGVPCSCGKRSCPNPGKHPRTPHGCSDATTDDQTIRGWWSQWPEANVAVATGHDGLVVLDVDPRKAGDETLSDLQNRYGKLPPTCEVLTGGGGQHCYFLAPLDPQTGLHVPVPNSAELVGPGLDIRGTGGYVVAPPSLHASGKSYAWEVSGDPSDGVQLAEIPAWLLALALRRRTSSGASQPAPETVTAGGRNDAMYRLACSLRAKGLDIEEILAAMLIANQRRCVPPLDEVEVRAIAESAAKRPAGKTRHGPPPQQPARPAPTSGAGAASSATPPRQREPGDDDDVGSEPAAEQPATYDWTIDLRYSKEGALLGSFGNICKILRNDERFGRDLKYNEMRLTPELRGEPVTDAVCGAMREAFEQAWNCDPAVEKFRAAMLSVSHERKFHPVISYLDALRWDGVSRIDAVADSILHAGTAPLTIRMVACFFISTVARAYKPGCKVDTTLVLVGKQGLCKSWFFRILGEPWFSDSAIDMTNKDALLQLHDSWIYEWPEIEAITSQKHAGTVKAFVSSQIDIFRPPYGASVVRVPRTNVIVGTTNTTRFLEDETGSRRFWAVDVAEHVEVDLLATLRDQLWAEAVARFRSGETWWLDEVSEQEREVRAEEHRVRDPWEDVVARWLHGLQNDAIRPQDLPVTSREIMAKALDLPAAQQHRGSENRVGAVMRALGWTHRRIRVEARHLDAIGRDRAWVWERGAQSSCVPSEGLI